MKTINPYTLQTIQEYQPLTPSQLQQVLNHSQEAFHSWKKTTFDQRARILSNVATLLRQHQDLYARLITTEMGKVITEARAEIQKCANTLDYYAQNGHLYLQNITIPSSAKTQSYIAYDPIGTIFAIMPWNYPFWQVIRYAAPCLLSGNTTILKHAPNVFGCGQALQDLFIQAGLPQYVFQNVIIDTDLVEQIIAHNAVQGVTLTGSDAAGAIVGSLAGKHIKKSVLELGGSDPFIVLQDADLQQAAKIASNSRMMNAGQACICAKRFIVHQKVKDQFQDLFINEIKKIKTGNPLDDNTTMATMARIDLAQKLESQTQQSIKKGAQIIIGGNRQNCFFEPSLITNASQGMDLYDQEVFGPLAVLTTAKDDQHAIQIANNTKYGLAASIWTKDIEKAQYLARQIDAGGVFVNALVHSDPRLPFGGIKKSGYGRELSETGIKEFMNIKTIYVN